MRKVRFTLNVLAAVMFILFVSSAAQAQATRTWVSGVGDDVNPCSRTAPCKTYAGAVSKTAAGGEISTLDPGGFGAVTITKSLTIEGTKGQGYGSILACGTNGVIVNDSATATPRTIKVKLRNLNINGCRNTTSPGTDGVRFVSGSALTIEDTVIDGFSDDGIEVVPFAAATGSFLSLRNVSISDCGGAGAEIEAVSTGTTTVMAERVNIVRCGTGIDAQNGTRATISDSVISLNTTGVALSEATSGTTVNIADSTIAQNSGTGLSVTGGSRGRIARCVVASNATSLAPAASWDTGGNNTIMGNTTNTAPGGTLFPQN